MICRCLAFIVTATALVSASLAAQPQIKHEAARPISSVDGADLFNAYCAVCHGKDLKGHGPAEPALKAAIPDLTTMAKRKGKFSTTDVEEVVLGRGRVPPAHGSPDMPMWGPVFRSLSEDDAIRKLQIANLVKYIESQQQK